jgi:hypothetical protein
VERRDLMNVICRQPLLKTRPELEHRAEGSRDSTELDLPDGMAWSMPVRDARTVVKCLSGVVWITCEGDPEDHVLSGGSSFSTSRRGRLAMMAFQPARVRVRTGGD